MQRGALRRRGYAKLLFYFKKLLSAFSAGAVDVKSKCEKS